MCKQIMLTIEAYLLCLTGRKFGGEKNSKGFSVECICSPPELPQVQGHEKVREFYSGSGKLIF